MRKKGKEGSFNGLKCVFELSYLQVLRLYTGHLRSRIKVTSYERPIGKERKSSVTDFC